MHHPQLLADIGFTGDGAAAEQILNGTYVFPPVTETYTKLILTEACALYCSLGKDGIVDLMKRQDFQDFWLHAREKTESSKSLLRFGHYCAAAHDKVVSQLHTSSLNAIYACGVAPARWRGALTVLLEKVLNIQLVEILHAICLLEADFNWLNKLIFAHRLERFCQKQGLVPPEQFAKSKSSCEEASVVKNLVCDDARILHNSLAITSVDLDQCFKRSARPIAGVAARAHKVSRQLTHLMLSTMQMMEYFIKSGFDIAKELSFCGSTNARLMGLGQGSGAAPIGMRSMITLVDNSYKRLGHGMNAKFSLADRISLYLLRSSTWTTLTSCTGQNFMASPTRLVWMTFKGERTIGGCLYRPSVEVSSNIRVSGTCSRGNLFVGSQLSRPGRNCLLSSSRYPFRMDRPSQLNESLSTIPLKLWVCGTTPSMTQRLAWQNGRRKGWIGLTFSASGPSNKETPGSVSHLSSTPSGPMASTPCIPSRPTWTRA
jgi:hypothetical protein